MKKIMPLLLMLLMLGGCTGSCGGTTTAPVETPVRTPTPVTSLPPAPAPTPSPIPSDPVAVRPLPSHTRKPTPTHTVKPSVAPVPSATALPAPTPTAAPSPTEADIIAAYGKTEEAYSWFHMATLPSGGDSKEYNGATYYKVDYPNLTTLADLRGYLRTLLSDEVVDTLLPADGTQYIDLEGALYVVPSTREADLTKGEARYEVVLAGTSKFILRVTVQVLDTAQEFAAVGSESHSFPYERVGDKWIFTNFYLYR